MPKLGYRLNFCVYPAPDLPDQWVAYCLELDLVTQGNDAQHALSVLSEAVALLVLDATDLPVLELRSPPAEAFREFQRAPITGQLDLTVNYHWDAGQLHPELDISAPTLLAS